jgi:hypothetical protein
VHGCHRVYISKCHSFCPVVRIGSPSLPPPQVRVASPSLGPWGTLASGGRGGESQLKRLARNPGAPYTIIPLRWTLYSAHNQTFIKKASGMTLKDDGNGFLSILNMCYTSDNEKVPYTNERLQRSELIFLVKKNKHCLIVYLLTYRLPLLLEEVIICLSDVHFGVVIMS